MTTDEYDYDIAVTFAGEDRSFVQAVVRQVTTAGFKVFYDQDEQITLWGEELSEYFPTVYEKRSRYAVMFVSRHYAAKPWTRLERRSVLLRALHQTDPYLLPVRLDRTELDGVRSTISYLDGNGLGPDGIARAICAKLGSRKPAEGGGQFNGFVPRNDHEATTLLGERPAAWEYLLFSYALIKGIEEFEQEFLDFCMDYAEPTDHLPNSEVEGVIERELAVIQTVIRNFSSVLSERVQRSAFGLPGEPGAVDQILHTANRYVSVYASFLRWAARIRGYATASDEVAEVCHALAAFASQPIREMRRFAYEYRDMADTLFDKLTKGENVTISFVVHLEIGAQALDRYDRALRKYRRSKR